MMLENCVEKLTLCLFVLFVALLILLLWLGVPLQ